MPPASASGVVQEMLKSAPAPEQADALPPTPVTPEPSADNSKTPEHVVERSAFDQELIGELDQEDHTAFESLTPEERKRTLGLMRKQYRRVSKQMTELGTLRKSDATFQRIIQTMRKSGKSEQEIADFFRPGSVASEAAPSKANGSGTRGLAALLAEAKTPEEREQAREIQQRIREEMEDIASGMLGKEIRPIRDRLESSDRYALTKRSQALDQVINDLEDQEGYPGSFIETHREAMHRLGLRETELSGEDLLVRVAGFKAVMAAKGKVKADPVKADAPIVKKAESEARPKDRYGRFSISGLGKSLLLGK